MAGEDSERGREPGAFCAKKTERARCAGALRIPKEWGMVRLWQQRLQLKVLSLIKLRKQCRLLVPFLLRG